MSDQRLSFGLVNLLCRVMGLWFVFVCSAAMLLTVFALVAIVVAGRYDDIFYFVQMIVGFGVGIAIGVVGLTVRFRPDLPKLTKGQSANWWNGDLILHKPPRGPLK